MVKKEIMKLNLFVFVFVFVLCSNAYGQQNPSDSTELKTNNPEIEIIEGKEFEIVRANVSFQVDTKGRIINVKVHDIKCYECTEKQIKKYKDLAKNSIIASPNWTPGVDSLGNKIIVDYKVPVKLTIELKRRRKKK
jgi:hypothetical protein